MSEQAEQLKKTEESKLTKKQKEQIVNDSIMAVYNKHKLTRNEHANVNDDNNLFNISEKKGVVRRGLALRKAYVKEQMNQADLTGFSFELDLDKSVDFIKGQELKRIQKIEDNKTKGKLKEQLTNLIK